MSSPYDSLSKTVATMISSFEETKKEVTTTEMEQVKALLKKYDVYLGDDINKNDTISKYKFCYNQLNKYALNKRKQIKNFEKLIDGLIGSIPTENFTKILNEKKRNTNKIIKRDNCIVDKIMDLETTIYNDRMKALENMKVKQYDIDQEMDIINNSLYNLKQWSNKNTFDIIFDSNFQGTGSNNVLHDEVINKSNLYLITFDCNNNVFGGYVNEKINKSNDYINDKNAFVFSLIRDGNVKNTKYPIKSNESGSAFYLQKNNNNDHLYSFANDIVVKKINDDASFCYCIDYDYNNKKNPFIDATNNSNTFRAKRIIVIQMK